MTSDEKRLRLEQAGWIRQDRDGFHGPAVEEWMSPDGILYSLSSAIAELDRQERNKQ